MNSIIKNVNQMEELIQLVTTRISIEQQYASRMLDIAKQPLRINGFAAEDQLISNVFNSFKKVLFIAISFHCEFKVDSV